MNCQLCNKKTIATYWNKLLKKWLCFECNEDKTR